MSLANGTINFGEVIMPEIIRTENVCKVFHLARETVHALKNINMSVNKGTLTILKGRSGSGKTTLMNIIGTLDNPTSGMVYFKDFEMTKLSDKRKDDMRRKEIGFVFQSVALISMMSAYENVDFGLRLAGVSMKDRDRRVEECLNIVGLGKRMHHKPQELSGGEQQRVAIARAIAHRPQILFADEPTAELDTHNGLQVVKLFKSLVEREGLTVLMTTHDPGLMEVADSVFCLEDGEIVNE
jgi:putative ABC transport system ATP-binding protein